uniref:RRM domain-containing protein n=1 Tax=Entamoeba invadens TaxID=33085 RepID=S0AY95_ENTIV|nr:hypothetical protein, conserved [Entamoeba invadens]
MSISSESITTPHPGKVYVGGFPTDFTCDALKSIFSVCGQIESAEIFHKWITFCHIIFTDSSSCKKAIEMFEQKDMGGYTFRVGEMKMTAPKAEVKNLRSFGDIQVSVVLVRPMHEENIGAIGRLCANFDVKALYVVNPECKIGEETMKISRHGKSYIEHLKIYNNLTDVKQECGFLIGFTAREGKGNTKNKRVLIKYQETCEILKTMQGDVGLVFGNESNGLNPEEAEACDLLNKIDIQTSYPVLNLSHAVSIGLSYFHLKLRDAGEMVPSECKEKVVAAKIDLASKWEHIVKLSFGDRKDNGSIDVMKKILGRVVLTEREAAVLEHAFNGINYKLLADTKVLQDEKFEKEKEEK